MIDTNSRQRLQQSQQNKNLVNGLSKAMENTANNSAAPLLASIIQQISQLNDKVSSGLTEDIKKLPQIIKANQLSTEQFEELTKLLSNLNNSLQVLDGLKTKLDEVPTLILPKETQLSGEVSVSEVKKLPPVEVLNFPKIEIPKTIIPPFPTEMGIKSLPPVVISNFKELSNLISNLQSTTLQAMQAMQVKFPESFKISDEVKVSEFSDLLEGIEELKKGFNILIKTTQEARGTSSAAPMKVEIVADLPRPMVNPVTNISVNGLGGFAKSTAVTVTSALTPLPGEVLSSRRSLIIYNNGSQTVEIGGSTFAFGGGLPVPASTYSPSLDASSKLIVYGRVASGTADLRILEMSDIATGR